MTVTGTGCTQNFTYNGVSTLLLSSAGTSCVLTFSKPLDTSSFTIDLGAVNQGETTGIATNAGPYSVQAADLTTPSPVFNQAANATASGGNITAPNAALGGGRFRFVSAPPASITSLTISGIAMPGGGVTYRVCADDAGAVVGPAPVPTMTEWAMILFGAILAGGAALYIQRHRLTV